MASSTVPGMTIEQLNAQIEELKKQKRLLSKPKSKLTEAQEKGAVHIRALEGIAAEFGLFAVVKFRRSAGGGGGGGPIVRVPTAITDWKVWKAIDPLSGSFLKRTIKEALGWTEKTDDNRLAAAFDRLAEKGLIKQTDKKDETATGPQKPFFWMKLKENKSVVRQLQVDAQKAEEDAKK